MEELLLNQQGLALYRCISILFHFACRDPCTIAQRTALVAESAKPGAVSLYQQQLYQVHRCNSRACWLWGWVWLWEWVCVCVCVVLCVSMCVLCLCHQRRSISASKVSFLQLHQPLLAMKGRNAGQLFKAVWSTDIFPKIKSDYERLKVQLPSRTKKKLDEKDEEKRKKEADKEKRKRDEEKDEQGREQENKGPEEQKRKRKRDEEKKDNKGPEEPPVVVIMKRVLDALKEKQEHRNVSMNLAWTGPVDNQSLEEAIPYDKVVAMAIDLFCDTSEAAKVSSTAVAASAEGEEIKLGKPAPSVAEVLNQEAEKTGNRSWKIPPRGRERLRDSNLHHVVGRHARDW